MNWIKAGIIMALSVALLLYLTRPSQQDVEDFVHAVARSQLMADDLEKTNDPAVGPLLAICRRGHEETCREALRQAIRIDYRSRIVYADVTITGLGPENHCRAYFNQLTCTGAR